MRKKIHDLFGYRMADDESVTAYLGRMDKIGQLDQLKINKLIGMVLDELESMTIDIKDNTKILTDQFVKTPIPTKTKVKV